ncbi:MAG: 1-acyl-sn-glycerol-3-phosphate acyltransferase [Acidimicrobiales bacterium]|nr:1-acyl-sn-glycerol-3-phosphate acyltransferase [Acidimicrobiales bacterium]
MESSKKNFQKAVVGATKLKLKSEYRHAKSALRPSFPYGKPTLPGVIEPPKKQNKLGVDYNTDWARKPAMKFARRVVLESLARPVIHLIASPTILGDEIFQSLKGPFIFTANHASHLDTGLLLTCLPENIRSRCVAAAAADYFFDTPMKAFFAASVLNAVPMERLKVNRRSALMAAELIEEGWNLIIFPEGGRTPDGWGQPFKGGAAYLAIRTGAPIIPVHLHGTRQLLGKGARRLVTGTTKVTFGKPITPFEKEDARKLAERVQDAVACLADEAATTFWEAKKRNASKSTPLLEGHLDKGWRKSFESYNLPSPSRPSRPSWPPK